MTEQIKNILAELKAIQTKLPELRDLYWLKIDRYNEADQQRGVAFDEKFEQQREKLFRAIDNFSTFIEKSFAPSAEEVARQKALQKLRTEFPGFDDWNEEAKKALLEREMRAIKMISKPKHEVISRHSESKKLPFLLQVVFPDGTVIADNKATQTFVQTIEKIGIEKVVQLNLDSIVRTDKNFERTAQLVQIGNCFVNTHSSTTEKKRQLEIISNLLNLNLKVEVTER
jgi:hypothetical protein